MKVSGDIGVISDTHALLRPEAVRALDGCELILHAGDIGNSRVIPALKERAAVVAIRGNIDKGPWADEYPISEAIEVNGKFIYLIHNIDELDSILLIRSMQSCLVIPISRRTNKKMAYFTSTQEAPARDDLGCRLPLADLQSMNTELRVKSLSCQLIDLHDISFNGACLIARWAFAAAMWRVSLLT